MNNKIIFHNLCADGSCSAGIISYYLGNKEKTFIPMKYGDVLSTELSKNDCLWIVDFSFPTVDMVKYSESVLEGHWFDHHESARLKIAETKLPNFEIVLDNNRSGAMLTWNTLFPNKPVPKIIEHVQDRDLWTFLLPDTRAISEFILNNVDGPEDPFWETMFNDDGTEIEKIIKIGQNLLKAKEQRIKNAINGGYYGKFCGQNAFYVNSTTDMSDIGERVYLSSYAPVVVVIYRFVGQEEIHFSLRSNQIKVRELAERFGGGGHDYAAGFKITIESQFKKLFGDVPNMC